MIRSIYVLDLSKAIAQLLNLNEGNRLNITKLVKSVLSLFVSVLPKVNTDISKGSSHYYANSLT